MGRILLERQVLLNFAIFCGSLVVAYYTLTLVNGLTYKIVLVFITLIVLSNCVAKLYARLVLKISL